MEIWPGESYPLGATYNGTGTNFAIFSEVATGIDLCLFDESGNEVRLTLPECTGFVWHGYVPDVGPGQQYGFRVRGPYAPRDGHRCNPQKLLMDPYAKAVAGNLRYRPEVFGYAEGDPFGPPNTGDSAPYVPRSVVANPYFDWADDRHPRTPWHKTVIYEAHVKALTARHPDVPPEQRGTYRGLSHPAIIDHLLSLGVTAVELMPVHHFVHERQLVDRGLTNAWGYNTLSYFAPHGGYASQNQRSEPLTEFKQMVRELHLAGIEVILDVVYNHTAEGDHLGPTLSFRGIDNAAYYRIRPDDRSRYLDFTGCGNSLNMGNGHVLQLVMDSLRYWVEEMHVDGFRFDLAAALARELHDVNRLSTFFQIIQQDPVISQVKLIAEPWDIGEGGYQVGNFPPQWSEWNGRYRDTVRDFWRGQEQTLAEFAYRFTGSSDLYASTARKPHASINFVTCHDGFTLTDLVSYNDKHNEGNGEDNRDGESHNRSWNCGNEGPAETPAIAALRNRQKRNFLTTMLFSQGVPMLLSGDEIGKTQLGNNNAYCHDNPLLWLDWENADGDMLEFTKNLIELRRKHPILRRRRWFEGTSIRGTDLTDIGWFQPNGEQMTEHDWRVSFARTLCVFLNGMGIRSPNQRGGQVVDDSFLVLFNAHHDALDFTIPKAVDIAPWTTILDTTEWTTPPGQLYQPGEVTSVTGRSIRVLRHEHPGVARANTNTENYRRRPVSRTAIRRQG